MRNRGIKFIAFSILLCILFVFPVSAKYSGGMSITKSDGETEARYCYFYEDYSRAKNEWKQVWDNWYYFGDDYVTLQNTWAEIDGKWYYFDQWSVMLHDTTTPDGYTVGSDGAWIQEEAVQ